MNGTQALVRVLLAQRSLDRRRGLRTAGYISGYRGSPLGNVDTTLWSIAERLKDADIVFQPGLNEDIAATAIRGTQQLDAVPDPAFEGVYAAWYGKGPGVDRSGDALKHGNYAGSHRHGGVLLFYGDDHAGKSSTVAHQSEQALAASLIPSLYPANVQEIFDYGLLGLALSRFSGSWVAIKCMNEVAEQTATVDIQLSRFETAAQAGGETVAGLHAHQGAFNPLREEQVVVEQRLPMVHRFVREHAIDKVVIHGAPKALGIVAAGKSYGDVRSALALLGLDEAAAAAAGIALYKVGLIWPLEPAGIAEFSAGLRSLLVVEEKKSFLELQTAAILINRADRPTLVGKRDENGAPLLSSVLPLEPAYIAAVIVGRLEALGLLSDDLRDRRDALTLDASEKPVAASLKRTPYFCSGCPHNRSTLVPDGSMSMTGIGCHTMANFVRPAQALLPTQMGGEGGNWLGLAPFTRTRHVFQNMGDGTYYHSGLLAIRAAVAAGVNITFKILYNDAVAMTGGQPVDGPISVAAIAHQVHNEGVVTIHLLSDDPTRHRAAELPAAVRIGHRDTLDEVQRGLRETPGCSVLIYEQTCAAEKRRRRKRGTLVDPPKRLFIAKDVCEGCGDCSTQSSCISLTPLDTEFGRKRAIDQSSCNKDYSCINGFCPSFITVYDAGLRKSTAGAAPTADLPEIPAPAAVALGTDSFNLMIAGVGGTGVITVGALLGMAAHIEGLSVSLFDMTGLSQKNGAVFTHVRIARDAATLHAQRLGRGEADVLLAFDLVAALSPEAASTLRLGATRAIANADVSPTAALQFQRDFSIDAQALVADLTRRMGDAAVTTVDASALASGILGDSIGANLFMLGIAAQSGLLPVGIDAIEAAVTLNGVAVSFNIRAFRLGRLWVHDRPRVTALVAQRQPTQPAALKTLAEVIAHRVAHLTEYQGLSLARRYSMMLARVQDAEARVAPGSDQLSQVVARNYAKVLAYKDEFEVARLLTHPSLHADIKRTFADGGRLAVNLAPPLIDGPSAHGRPKKREFGAWIFPLLKVLARLRGLRGGPFDPFGRTVERRLERQLIADYHALIERVLDALRPDNHREAARLLDLVDAVRGYGPVKLAAMNTYRAGIATSEAAWAAHP